MLILPRDNKYGQQWEYFSFRGRKSAEHMLLMRGSAWKDTKDTTAQWSGCYKTLIYVRKQWKICYHDIFWTIVGAEATEH